MTPHTLVGGDQTTLTATASARADRRDLPSEAWSVETSRENAKTHTRYSVTRYSTRIVHSIAIPRPGSGKVSQTKLTVGFSMGIAE